MIAEWCSACGGETLLPSVNGENKRYTWECRYCGEELKPCAQFDCASRDCCQKEMGK